MRFRTLAVIFLGTTLAGFGSFAVMNLAVNPGSANAMNDIEMVDVIVARTEIAYGQAIEPALLTTQSWPESAVVPGVYTSTEPFSTGKPLRAMSRIHPGELILVAKTSAPGERVTIVQRLTPGHRAMAINVNAASAVGGFVAPGDRVDIVMTQGSADVMRAVTVLQNVRVVGIDQTAEEHQGAPKVARTITVEVLPDEGQRLALAQKAGQLSLSLRDLDAPDLEPLTQVQLSDLFDDPEPEPVELAEDETTEPAPLRRSITVRRGTSVEKVFVE